MLHQPFYDPNKSYEENYQAGPFGAFLNPQKFINPDEPRYNFLNFPVYLPFGIAAGPLLNSKFVKAALDMGFDLPVYKTVRTRFLACHPWPNVLGVDLNGDLTMEKAKAGLTVKGGYDEPLSITNSFGVPSQSPDQWQPDLADCVKYAGDGHVVIGSFQGTKQGDGKSESFINDYVLAARLVKETGAKILEANFSCPNEGTCDLACFDINMVRKTCEAIKNEIGNTPLLIKMAYFASHEHLSNMIKEVGNIIDGISTINTIPAAVRKPTGEPALPGEGRLVSGVCGRAVKWAGLDMVRRLKALRDELGMKFVIVGVGGVCSSEDYNQYISAGANVAMSATGAMWNPYLAQEIKGQYLGYG